MGALRSEHCWTQHQKKSQRSPSLRYLSPHPEGQGKRTREHFDQAEGEKVLPEQQFELQIYMESSFGVSEVI